MCRAFTVLTVVTMTLAASVSAHSLELKGRSYAFTGSAACIVAPSSAFDASGHLTQPARAYTRSFSVAGIRTFGEEGADGTGGTVEGTAIGFGVAFASHFSAPSAGKTKFRYSFHYSIDGDGSWTATVDKGSFVQDHLIAPDEVRQSTVEGVPPIRGTISQDGKTLIAAQTDLGVETVTYADETEKQICHRSRVFIELPKGN